MTRILVIEGQEAVRRALIEQLRARPEFEIAHEATAWDLQAEGLLRERRIDTVVFAPRPGSTSRSEPDLADAEHVLQVLAAQPPRRVVLLSSAAVYGPNNHNRGLLTEDTLSLRQRQNPIAARWLDLEERAADQLGSVKDLELVILRPAAVPVHDSGDPLAAVFAGRWAFTLAGHDPSIQLLSPEDLARAIVCAAAGSGAGIFNVAPDGVIPLRQALRLAGVRRLPIPYLVQRAVRWLRSRLGGADTPDRLEYLRYSWTVSGATIKQELGLVPRQSSAEALCVARLGEGKPLCPGWEERSRERFDEFGLDPAYIATCNRRFVGFLDRHYWRIEWRGLEQVPREGRAMLVGVHRGFMPWDGVTTVHAVSRATGRFPRFLIHPGLVKFPVLHDFMIKQGGLIACHENADRILQRDDLLAIYPEGIRGAFALYRDAYRLKKFGRDDYVRMALRNQAPIIPFVTVGSAEAYPILGKLEWAWWKRYAQWPFIPLTTTFPFLPPIPLPVKWHTLFLPALHLERRYPPEAAEDEAVVQQLSQDVRGVIEETLQWMLARRRSWFRGEIFAGGVPNPAARMMAEEAGAIRVA